MAIWAQLLRHRQSLVARHAEDVCLQAGRRIEVLVESRLRVAELFARRWSTHEARDFSQTRFAEFAGLLTHGLPGYRALRLRRLPAAAPARDWVAPRGARSRWAALPPAARRQLFARASSARALLSPPVGDRGGSVVFAALRLARGDEVLGHLVVELDATRLIGAGFHHRIRSEFHLRVADGDDELFRFADDAGPERLEARPASATHGFTLRDRRWTVTVAPRDVAGQASGAQELPPLALGLALSLGVALLVHLLSRRIALYRTARDQALAEISSRQLAEATLRRSEQRYRSVFDGATDGLLVLDDGGRIVDANRAAATMHGHADPDELTGRPVIELIAPDNQPAYDLFRSQIESEGRARLDSVDRRADGSLVDVEVRGTRLDRPRDEPQLLAILTDVTHRRKALARQATLARKALLAQEEERARVSRELHDELGQILTALHLEIQLLDKRAARGAGGPEGLATAAQMVTQAADELRRICRGLRPPLLDDLGLEPAARLLVEEFASRTELDVDLEVELEAPVPTEVALCCYRVLQESLNNIRRHADARGVEVSLVAGPSQLVLSIYDDGRGFDVDANERAGGFGIAGMRERAALVGGTLEVRSVAGEGTRVVLRLARGRAEEER